MTNQRLSQIVKALMRAKQLGAKLTGKSALEKELNAWISGPDIPLVYDWEPRTAEPAPIPYEEEFPPYITKTQSNVAPFQTSVYSAPA